MAATTFDEWWDAKIWCAGVSHKQLARMAFEAAAGKERGRCAEVAERVGVRAWAIDADHRLIAKEMAAAIAAEIRKGCP